MQWDIEWVNALNKVFFFFLKSVFDSLSGVVKKDMSFKDKCGNCD